MTNQITELVNRYEQHGDFSHYPVSTVQISEAAHTLGLHIPSQYADFLLKFGHGGIGGVEIIGIGKTGKLLFVSETLKYRKYGLPETFIVVENCDEWVYCINASDGSVVSWSNGIVTVVYTDFSTYLLDRFNDAVENL